MPAIPNFDLQTSALLRGLLDGTIAQVWEFWGEGEYPESRDLKDEADRLTAEVLATWSDADLEQFAERDRWARIGLADVGIETAVDPRTHRRHRLAMRVVEVGLASARQSFAGRALREDPRPTDRAFAQVPGLWDALAERNFLLPLSADRAPTNPISADPYLYFGNYALFPHPELRNARELFWSLCELAHVQGVSVQVAIDPFRVLPRDQVPSWLLEDYWYGMQVTQANLDSVEPHDLGRAVHWRNLQDPEAQALEAFYPLLATEFDWSLRDETIKILQVEEIRPVPAKRGEDELVLSRYLHSERDTERHCFIHLDGAIKGYPAPAYQPSRTQPLARRGPASIYRKLFRLDGVIPDDRWGMTVGHFFRHNELVAEHLGQLVDERIADG